MIQTNHYSASIADSTLIKVYASHKTMCQNQMSFSECVIILQSHTFKKYSHFPSEINSMWALSMTKTCV